MLLKKFQEQKKKKIENVSRYYFNNCKAAFKLTSQKINLFSKYNLMLVNYLFIMYVSHILTLITGISCTSISTNNEHIENFINLNFSLK